MRRTSIRTLVRILPHFVTLHVRGLPHRDLSNPFMIRAAFHHVSQQPNPYGHPFGCDAEFISCLQSRSCSTSCKSACWHSDDRAHSSPSWRSSTSVGICCLLAGTDSADLHRDSQLGQDLSAAIVADRSFAHGLSFSLSPRCIIHLKGIITPLICVGLLLVIAVAHGLAWLCHQRVQCRCGLMERLLQGSFKKSPVGV